MRSQRQSIVSLAAACGAAVALASVAAGQTVINISGATLLENFIIAPAATNDYLDVDGNGVARIFNTNQQLAPFGLPPTPPSNPPLPTDQVWIVQYRAVGSVNGFQELVDFGSTFVTDDANGMIKALTASRAYNNRTRYINGGVCSNAIFNFANPGGAPVRADTSTLQATYAFSGGACNLTGAASGGGIRIDMAPVDVPSVWAVQNFAAGTASFSRLPGQAQYGRNPRRTLNKQGGTTGANFDHLLANLGPRSLFDPTNPGAADANTIFDTPIALAPVAVVTNLGTGMRRIDQSAIRHGFVTGRLPSGENLIFTTRDSGSGTRNAFNNTTCTDPSWGMGENIGALSVLASANVLGPEFLPGNKVGNPEVEATVTNHRIAIGYAGAERGFNNGWLSGGRLEVLAVRNDLQGGTEYSRPTINDVLDNDVNGYLIAGPSVFATIGDRLAAPVSKGGTGNGRPAIRNVEAAAYLNNMVQSVAAFTGNPGGSQTLFTPGEFLATTLILTAALDNIADPRNPCTLTVNPSFNQSLQDYARANNILGNPAYATFGTFTLNGKVPNRLLLTGGATYSDGVANGATYIDQSGAVVIYADNLKTRNRIGGDFNGDGKRDRNDAADMIRAWRQRYEVGNPVWSAPNGTGDIAGAPGSDACIEILGDFDGDGSFTTADVRYWCDGLGVDPVTRQLNRWEAFKAVDDAYFSQTGNNNFFGTVVATSCLSNYRPGLSAGDVSKPDVTNGVLGVTRGFAPSGADGRIDADDAAYITAQYTQAGITGSADWSDLEEAQLFDLSADVNGDLKVDASDLAAIGAGGCYADCDLSTGCGVLDIFDFLCFQNRYAANEPYACNCDTSTGINTCDIFDFLCFQNAFAAGCP